MMQRQKFLAIFLWLIAVSAFAWSSYILMSPENPYLRDTELSKARTSLQQIAHALGQETQDGRVILQLDKNLEGITDGTVLLEKKALHIGAFLSLFAFGLACLNLLGSKSSAAPLATSKPTGASRPDESFHSFQNALEQTIEELSQIKTKLQISGAIDVAASSSASGHQKTLESQCTDIVIIESQLLFLKNQAQQLAEQNAKALEDLQRLSSQAEDYSHYASSSRLEWNSLAIKLSQFKESQGRVRVQAEMLGKLHQGCQELLTKSLDFSNNHAQHAERAKTGINQIADVSKGTTEIFSKLIHAMSESNSDVTLANRLVKGLSERAEEIVNTIDVIDDIAEQTNQLALNASIEAARAGEQGKGFAVVAAEVRNLAVRSSTATRSITELLETIQAEADQASTCLEKTNTSVATAHARIVDVDHRCRETMNLSRQVSGELADIIRITTEHTQEISNIEKQGVEVSRLATKLIRRLDDVDQINTNVQQESNQLAVSTDRLSRLMSRQYFSIQHSERLSAGQTEGFKALLEYNNELLGRTQSLRNGWEQQYRNQILTVPHSRRQNHPEVKSLSRSLDYCQTNLDIIRGRAQTVTLVKELDTTDTTDTLALAPHNADAEHEISMDSNLQKVS